MQCLAQVSRCLPSRPEGAAGHTERWHTGGGHHHLGFNTHTSTNHYLGCLLAIILSGASGPTQPPNHQGTGARVRQMPLGVQVVKW